MNQHTYHAPLPGSGEIAAEFPCSQSQLLWWILDSINPGDPAYNIAVCWEIRGRFSAASIEAAFERVIARHEILRRDLIAELGHRTVDGHTPFGNQAISFSPRTQALLGKKFIDAHRKGIRRRASLVDHQRHGAGPSSEEGRITATVSGSQICRDRRRQCTRRPA